MTPDVPDTPDRTDAIARWFAVHVIDCHISWQDAGRWGKHRLVTAWREVSP